MNTSANFWRWVFDGSAQGGLSRWFNRWLLLHGLLGWFIASRFHGSLQETVKTLILPLASALFGLTFAWVSTANNIVMSSEFKKVMDHSRGGVVGVVNYLQMVVYVVLGCATYWGVVGLGPYPSVFDIEIVHLNYAAQIFGFSLTSFALTECASSISLTRLAMLAHNVASTVGQDSGAVDNKE